MKSTLLAKLNSRFALGMTGAMCVEIAGFLSRAFPDETLGSTVFRMAGVSVWGILASLLICVATRKE